MAPLLTEHVQLADTHALPVRVDAETAPLFGILPPHRADRQTKHVAVVLHLVVARRRDLRLTSEPAHLYVRLARHCQDSARWQQVTSCDCNN